MLCFGTSLLFSGTKKCNINVRTCHYQHCFCSSVNESSKSNTSPVPTCVSIAESIGNTHPSSKIFPSIFILLKRLFSMYKNNVLIFHSPLPSINLFSQQCSGGSVFPPFLDTRRWRCRESKPSAQERTQRVWKAGASHTPLLGRPLTAPNTGALVSTSWRGSVVH